MTTENDKIFTIKQALAELTICKRTLYKLINTGLLKTIDITPGGGRKGIRQSEINRYLKSINGE